MLQCYYSRHTVLPVCVITDRLNLCGTHTQTKAAYLKAVFHLGVCEIYSFCTSCPPFSHKHLSVYYIMQKKNRLGTLSTQQNLQFVMNLHHNNLVVSRKCDANISC